MKLTDILKRNRELSLEVTGNKYKIGVISNITLNQFNEILELTLREKGINAEVEIGDYDVIVQDSSRFSDKKAVLIFWEAINFIDGLQDKISIMTEDEQKALTVRVENEIDLVLRNLANIPLVLINSFSIALFDVNPLKSEPLKQICKRLNNVLEDKLKANQIIVDLDYILAKVSLEKSIDKRMFHSSISLYSFNFFETYSNIVVPAFNAITGHAKKVLILDCDNTLWKGVLGEEGVQMNYDTPDGKIFREVQIIIKGMQKDGVLLSLCSKNNFSDVDEVLNKHPDIILKNEDFVAKKVNWQDKATNIRELAKELNLGMDSFIFVDDSSFEIGLIQKELPEVMCIQVPRNLSEYPFIMRELKQYFFTFSKTAEDDRKTEMYKEEQLRVSDSSRFNTIEDYLASLKLELEIFWDEQVPVPRSSQLTQKTNQFNLTTQRYTEIDISQMIANQDFKLANFSVKDCYGDYGITGLTIIKIDYNSSVGFIDSFLISCRVIGRNLEHKFFDEIISTLLKNGVTVLNAKYIKSIKNKQVESFYSDLGFEIISESEKQIEYSISLDQYIYKNIEYIKLKKQ